MKPIKLVISAFGPYGDKMPEIEFEQFENKGLFLICGDTGAGKTTIFDAICFALYGETSGAYRDTKNLRSEYAKSSEESFVDFYFSHQGKYYHVYRQPSFNRPKHRGEGVITQKERAVFYCQGELPQEGTAVVNNRVRELLQIDFRQFKQIAMIAQGEFWELLNASTEDRTKILRTIFMTSGYQNIVYKLKDKKDNSHGKWKNAQDSMIQYFGDVKPPEDKELEQNLLLLQKEAKGSNSTWNIEDMLKLLTQIISKDEEEGREKQKIYQSENKKLEEKRKELHNAQINNEFLSRLEKFQREREELEERREEIEELEQLTRRQRQALHYVKPAYDLLLKEEREIEETRGKMIQKKEEAAEAARKLAIAQESLEKAMEEKPKGEWYQQKVQKLQEDIEKYKERDGLILDIQVLEKQERALLEEEAILDGEERALKEKIKGLDERIKELQNCKAEGIRAQNQGKELAAFQWELRDIAEHTAAEYKQAMRELAEKQADFERALCQYNEAMEGRRRCENILDSCRAGILAQGLEEGSMCPVCGSLHHPKLAMLPGETASEEDYKKWRKQEEHAKQVKEDRLVEVERAKLSLEEKDRQIKSKIERVREGEWVSASFLQAFDKDYLEKDFSMDKVTELIGLELENLKNIVRENKKEQKSLQQDCIAYDKAMEDVEQARGRETEALLERKGKHDVKKENNRTSLTEKKTALKAFAVLEFPDCDTARRELEKARRESEKIIWEIEKAQEKEENIQRERARADAAVSTLQEALETQKNRAEQMRISFQQILTEKEFASREEFLQFLAKEEAIGAQEKKVLKYKQDVQINAQQLEQAREDAKGKVKSDENRLREELKEQSILVEQLRENNNQREHRIENNQEKRNKISAQRENVETYKKEYTLCDRLYRLVIGDIKNKAKITLEQYIQAAGFDKIIAAANKRLLPMSDGQYELFRMDDSQDKKSKNILNLQVQDNFTGHRRPVGNLSGGESFKASLSLALGLSDTVSSNLGGVQMDALFVDEGFGTLDKKSIENALDILIHLSKANKLVGIISHREELMESIPQQIQVKKTKEGSEIKIDTGF